MEWRCFENDWQKLYLTITCEQARIVGMDIIDRETEKCNCSEQRRYDVSADRGVSDMTIIATNYR